MRYAELATAIRRDEIPNSVTVLKRNRVRCVVRADQSVLKVYLQRPDRSLREARAIRRAQNRGLRTAEILDCESGWLALRFAPGRDASRQDLVSLLPAIQRMHQAGVLHRDLHVSNFRVGSGEPVLLDLQKALFLPWIPSWLRRRELGFLAYSLGEPLPDELTAVRGWRDRRAHRHARHRTWRCLAESSEFTRFGGGYRRRDSDPEQLEAALAATDSRELVKDGPNGRLFRHRGLVLKQFGSRRLARRAWFNAHGLEVRRIPVARALAVRDEWLVMVDAGDTLIDWVEASFSAASAEVTAALADTLGSLLAELHNRGIYHADLKANNLCWGPGRAPQLLDYGSVHFGRRVPSRRRIKNLAQLNAALPDEVDHEFRLRALTRYLQIHSTTEDQSALCRAVTAESLKRAHRWSGAGCT